MKPSSGLGVLLLSTVAACTAGSISTSEGGPDNGCEGASCTESESPRPLGEPCDSSAACLSGYCAGGTCTTTGLESAGEACNENADCASGDCTLLGSVQVCTQPCSNSCPGSGLACNEGTCVPANHCEGGVGPGCPGSGCDACDANATCVITQGASQCTCNPGYQGDGTTCSLAGCASNPCLNNGQCTETGSEFRCDCPTGYAGAACEIQIDDCAHEPCLNGGVCVDGVNTYSCTCPNGYSGTRCEVDACQSVNCENGGTCTVTPSGAVCDCIAGFTGDLCASNIDDCSPNPCQNGGTCTDGVNAYTCTCPSGFVGTQCDVASTACSAEYCVNGGTCSDGPSGPTCACPAGFSGDRCEVNIDDCSPNPCANGGACTDGVDTYTCTCASGYTGPQCTANVDDCSPNPCQNGGTCTDGVDTYTCTCAAGFTGPQCTTNIDDCSPNPCANGGACTDDVNGFTCACPTGFTGPTCTVNVDDCPMPDPCQNGGTCVDGVNAYTCNCPATWEGSLCQNDVDECATNICANGGVCVNTTGGFICNCPVGWSGATCTTPAACVDDDDCAEEQFCQGGTCALDACEPLATRCSGDDVIECLANGSGERVRFTCSGRGAAYDSQCIATALGEAVCTCEDDWDCPLYTACDVDQCVGTGLPPTCSLPPSQFSSVLPSLEIEWGGTQADNTAKDHLGNTVAFDASGQVVLTPVVANLDDDNGDGLINERDFPEIVFMTFCDSGNFRDDGVLRAVHGGGPNKGRDYFAACGNTVWHEGDDPTVPTCTCGDADLNPTFVPAVADLDSDGIPEIVTVVAIDTDYVNGMVRIYDNTGNILVTSAQFDLTKNRWAGGVTLANLDGGSFAEIIIGNDVFTLGHDNPTDRNLIFVDHFAGLQPDTDSHFLGPITCVADVLGTSEAEILQGSVVYTFGRPACANTVADCSSTCGLNGTLAEQAYCNNELYIAWDGGIDGGFCAVADVLGIDPALAPGRNNPLDGTPELVLVHEGRLRVYDFSTGVGVERVNLRAQDTWNVGTNDGGPPNVDDFDGDGFPEVGTAFSEGYVLFDLQPELSGTCEPHPLTPSTTTDVRAPNGSAGAVYGTGCSTDADCDPNPASGYVCNTSIGTCVCTHNSWSRSTEDDSSRATGSSVFDFNGDGAVEVVYNDECKFRVYDGLTGNVLFEEWSESRTRVEYPVVADTDNDGNAEIVFGVSNESGFCAGDSGNATIESGYNNGLEVWGDASDAWVSARRIWNQHAYHVTNVTESGTLPSNPPEGWVETNGRTYNTYRSNPRSFGVAPDLVVESLQVVAATGGCGTIADSAQIALKLTNQGDLRVGPGVVTRLYGDWGLGAGWEPLLDATAQPLEAVLGNTLEPRRSVFLVLPYNSTHNGEAAVPSNVRAVADSEQQERECNDETHGTDNNATAVAVNGTGPQLPELRLEVGLSTGCPPADPPPPEVFPTVTVTVFNDGNVAASNVALRFYAGDPDQGGSPLADAVLAGPIAPGSSVTQDFDINPFPECQSVRIFATVDPDGAIEECNDGNNSASQASLTECCFE